MDSYDGFYDENIPSTKLKTEAFIFYARIYANLFIISQFKAYKITHPNVWIHFFKYNK